MKQLIYIIIFVSIITSAYAIQQPSAYWHLDNITNQSDSIGQYTLIKYQGTNNISIITGKINNSLNTEYVAGTNGDSIYYYLNQSNILNQAIYNGNNFTLSYWMKSSINSSSQQYIMSMTGRVNNISASSPRGFIQNRLINGKIRIDYKNDTSGTQGICSLTNTSSDFIDLDKYVSDNNWHNIIIKYDTQQFYAYIDNTLYFNTSLYTYNTANNCIPNFNKYPLVQIGIMGRLQSNGTITSINTNTGYNGSLDEIIFWNSALNNTEIATVYMTGLLGNEINFTEQNIITNISGDTMNNITININDTLFLLAIIITLLVISIRISIKNQGRYRAFLIVSGLLLGIISAIMIEIIRTNMTVMSITLITVSYIIMILLALIGLILFIFGSIFLFTPVSKK